MLTGTNTSQTGGIFGQQQTPASSGFSLAPTTQTKGPSGQSGFQQGQLGGGGGGLKLSTSTAQSGLSLGGGLPLGQTASQTGASLKLGTTTQSGRTTCLCLSVICLYYVSLSFPVVVSSLRLLHVEWCICCLGLSLGSGIQLGQTASQTGASLKLGTTTQSGRTTCLCLSVICLYYVSLSFPVVVSSLRLLHVEWCICCLGFHWDKLLHRLVQV
jgi:hypothetical protein